MPILDLLAFPDPRLSLASEPVERFDTELLDLIADMEETMRARSGCVGISSPQVDRHQRVLIVDTSDQPRRRTHGRLILVNPQILWRRGTTHMREACLSVPDLTGAVQRARKIRVAAQDERGRACTYDCVGYEAAAIQHEIDHLDGILFIDRMSPSPRDFLWPSDAPSAGRRTAQA